MCIFITKIIGARLKEMRVANRYSQQQTAEMFGSTQATIGRYEQGLVDVSLDKLFWYAEIFEVSLDYIFGRTDDPKGHLYEMDNSTLPSDTSINDFIEFCFDPASPANAKLKKMLDAVEGKEHRCEFEGIDTAFAENGRYCGVPVAHKVTLGEIVDLLKSFKAQTQTLVMPEIPYNSFAKKLYSTYLSYLPKEKVSFTLKMNEDARGSFTELLKTEKCGQFSVNISKPGITKGQHWHNTKWEFFIVVAGHGLIQQRKIGTDEVLNFDVTGDKIEAIHMLPGYTHNIINLSETENLVTVMWANEQFDPAYPDTFFEPVE